MSRCFPYPPPGFTGNKASDALIDSIKLHKDKKADKEKRKEERREKKEKKREKKENKETVNSKLAEVGHEAHKDGENCAEFKGGYSLKRKQEYTEQLEGSSVTEEHGQPLNSQNPSYSSDGTQNSSKRRKQASFAINSHVHGNIIRIKLPLQKHKESERTVSKEQLGSTTGRNVQNKESVVSASKAQCCSTSGRNEMHQEQVSSQSRRTDLFDGENVRRTSQGDVSLTSFRANNSLKGLSSGPSIELGCSTSPKTDVLAQGQKQKTSGSVPGSCSTSWDKKMKKMNLKYNNLIQNLYQMAPPSELVDTDGEDWLFGGKPLDTVLNKRNVEKQFAVSSDVTCSSSSTLYPRAVYLPEAGIFALPYTVPF